MDAAPRAVVWLPDLDSSKLAWARQHPVHRTGLSRWWDRSRTAHYNPADHTAHDLVWPSSTVTWSDVVTWLREHPPIATALHQGAVVRIMTQASAKDMLAVTLGLAKQFPAAEIVVDLIINSPSLLSAWLASDRFTVATLLSPMASAAIVRGALVDRRGVELSDATKIESYVRAHPRFNAIIVRKTVPQSAFTLIDDRHQGWGNSVGVRVSELLARRSPNLWQRLQKCSDGPYVAAHHQARGLALHTLPADTLQRFSDHTAVLSEVASSRPPLLTVVAPPAPADDWLEYDDRLALLLGKLSNEGYATLAFGVPLTPSDVSHPIMYFTNAADSPPPPSSRDVGLPDLRDAVWSFAGVADSPSWLLSDVLLS